MSKFVKKHPLLKTMAAYMCINAAADMNEQIFIKKRSLENYHYANTARIAFTGGFVIAPLLHNWIRFIHKKVPGKTVTSIVVKVAADALLFAPLPISSFYIVTSILEGNEDFTAEWRQKFLKTWTSGWMYWPVIQTINFAFVPLHYKTSVYMPIASFAWMTYLCFLKEEKVKPKEGEELTSVECNQITQTQESIVLSGAKPNSQEPVLPGTNPKSPNVSTTCTDSANNSVVTERNAEPKPQGPIIVLGIKKSAVAQQSSAASKATGNRLPHITAGAKSTTSSLPNVSPIVVKCSEDLPSSQHQKLHLQTVSTIQATKHVDNTHMSVIKD